MVGFGGYPSVPPVLAARMLRRRPAVILHEQNAVLGRANRFLAPLRRRAGARASRDTQRVPDGAPTVVTGNPVRPAIAALAGAALRAAGRTRISLLVLGGSLGARVFSDVVPRRARAAARAAARALSRDAAMPARGSRARARRLCRDAASRPSWRRSSPTSPTGWRRRIW